MGPHGQEEPHEGPRAGPWSLAPWSWPLAHVALAQAVQRDLKWSQGARSGPKRPMELKGAQGTPVGF